MLREYRVGSLLNQFMHSWHELDWFHSLEWKKCQWSHTSAPGTLKAAVFIVSATSLIQTQTWRALRHTRDYHTKAIAICKMLRGGKSISIRDKPAGNLMLVYCRYPQNTCPTQSYYEQLCFHVYQHSPCLLYLGISSAYLIVLQLAHVNEVQLHLCYTKNSYFTGFLRTQKIIQKTYIMGIYCKN